jgi:hypothetical protein
VCRDSQSSTRALRVSGQDGITPQRRACTYIILLHRPRIPIRRGSILPFTSLGTNSTRSPCARLVLNLSGSWARLSWHQHIKGARPPYTVPPDFLLMISFLTLTPRLSDSSVAHYLDPNSGLQHPRNATTHVPVCAAYHGCNLTHKAEFRAQSALSAERSHPTAHVSIHTSCAGADLCDHSPCSDVVPLR